MKYDRTSQSSSIHLKVSCSRCRAILSGTEKFCPECGRKLRVLKTEISLDDILDTLENTEDSETKKKDSFREDSGLETTPSSECPFGKKTHAGCPSFRDGFCTACVYPTNPPQWKECHFFGGRYIFCGEISGKLRENHDF